MCDYNQHQIGWAKKILLILLAFFPLVSQTEEICWGKESDVADVRRTFQVEQHSPPSPRWPSTNIWGGWRRRRINYELISIAVSSSAIPLIGANKSSSRGGNTICSRFLTCVFFCLLQATIWTWRPPVLPQLQWLPGPPHGGGAEGARFKGPERAKQCWSVWGISTTILLHFFSSFCQICRNNSVLFMTVFWMICPLTTSLIINWKID